MVGNSDEYEYRAGCVDSRLQFENAIDAADEDFAIHGEENVWERIGEELENHGEDGAKAAKAARDIFSNALRGVSFNNDVELRAWLDEFFESRPGDLYRRGIETLVERWEQVVNNNGDFLANFFMTVFHDESFLDVETVLFDDQAMKPVYLSFHSGDINRSLPADHNSASMPLYSATRRRASYGASVQNERNRHREDEECTQRRTTTTTTKTISSKLLRTPLSPGGRHRLLIVDNGGGASAIRTLAATTRKRQSGPIGFGATMSPREASVKSGGQPRTSNKSRSYGTIEILDERLNGEASGDNRFPVVEDELFVGASAALRSGGVSENNVKTPPILVVLLEKFNQEKVMTTATTTTTSTTRNGSGVKEADFSADGVVIVKKHQHNHHHYHHQQRHRDHRNSEQIVGQKKAATLTKSTTPLMTAAERESLTSSGGGDGEMGKSPNEQLRAGSVARETWENKTDFLMSVIGFAVDLANVWRFPYLCFKNGGGAFLVPYILMVLLGGIPLFYMELALGQYHKNGPITTWGKICPLFKGIGYCVIMTAFYTDFFYNVIIAFALHYLFASFTTELPWSSCDNAYNSPACYEPSWSSGGSRECASAPVFINSSHVNASYRAISAAEEYFYKYFLGIHEERVPISHVARGIDNLGSVNWEMVACVVLVYLICYFSLWKGIKMSGKVVWFTAIFPYVVLIILLIRGVTLPGWEKGIEYYLKPNLEMLKMPSVWQDAATQVFFSLGPGFGVLMAYSSYNEFHNNVYFDALLTSSINCLTSFLSGFVIFSILGYMACKSGKPIHEVAQEGPGLAFVVYPEALATMPGASLWSIAFFLMLLTLGLDSSFGGSEAIITGLSDEYPIIKRNREVFVAILFIFYTIIGVVMCTKGGMLVMEWLIFYGTAWGLLIAVLCETVVISFVYGIGQFSADIHEMLGFAPGWYWKVCWVVGAPLFLLIMILSSFINYQPLQYQDYVYPYAANILGLVFALSSASAIPIVGLCVWYRQPGESCLKKLQLSLIPVRNQRHPSAGGATNLSETCSDYDDDRYQRESFLGVSGTAGGGEHLLYGISNHPHSIDDVML